MFPYQHISPLWREMQLSILCTGSPGWGSGPRTHWELSSLPEHISELALPPALPSCTPRATGICPQDLQEMLRGHWGSSSLLTPPSCTIPIAGTASGIAAIKILLSKQQSKDQPLLKSVLLQTSRLIFKITKVNGIQSNESSFQVQNTLCKIIKVSSSIVPARNSSSATGLQTIFSHFRAFLISRSGQKMFN